MASPSRRPAGRGPRLLITNFQEVHEVLHLFESLRRQGLQLFEQHFCNTFGVALMGFPPGRRSPARGQPREPELSNGFVAPRPHVHQLPLGLFDLQMVPLTPSQLDG